MPFASAPRRRLVLLLVVCVAAALGGLVGVTTASAASPWPTSMAITDIQTDVAAQGSLPSSVPHHLVAVGGVIHVTVTFNAVLPSDASLNVTSTAGTAAAPVPATATALAGHSDVTFDVHFDKAVNNVGLIATIAKGPAKGLTTGTPPTEDRFDVLTALDSQPATAGTAFSNGIGGDDTHCGNATTTAKVCEVVVLPSGARSDVFLSTGLCDASYGCNSKGALVQTLFADGGTDNPLYGQFNPATLIVKCDKSLCGTGQIHNVKLSYSLLGDGALDQTPADCPAKGTLGADLKPCIDWVQTKRDGSGDTILYLLFAHDIRVGAS